VTHIQDTEDIVEEAFMGLWEMWNEVEQGSDLKPLIFQIARNKLNDYLRKKYKLQEERKFVEEIETLKAIEEEVISNSKGDTQRKRYLNILEDLKSELTEKQKKLIKIKYEEGCSYTEIAERMQITVNNAKVTNNYIIKKLKKLWNQRKK
jgi:RNA polymerase sigma-70 factor (ECF subfamily)